MNRIRRKTLAQCLLTLTAAFGAAGAQDTSRFVGDTLHFPRVDGPGEEAARLHQLFTREADGYLLRSASSRLATLPAESAVWFAFPPELLHVYNSDLAYSRNDGGLWAGRGSSIRVSGGLYFSYGRLRVLFVPELLYSENQPYETWARPFTQEPPPRRNPFSSPWHTDELSVDYPLRFGENTIRRLAPGQSALVLPIGDAEVGLATENQWWGPGVRNALVLSSNAAGFPHMFARTARPLRTPFGELEARWLIGGLHESDYFDFDAGNDLRSISALGITWRPDWQPSLTLGAARSVFAPASQWSDVVRDFYQVFSDVGHPNAKRRGDTTNVFGRDQILSLFGRYVLPRDQAEVYFEWGRTELPVSLRDLLVEPSHTQGYTLGGQWLSDPVWRDGRIRLQAEASYIERSTTFRYRPIGSWYASRAVRQGYTHRGQPLGAAIGPGSSSQFLALDFIAEGWQAGAMLDRIRWLNDAHNELPLPDLIAWCAHDVSLLPGIRGSWRTKYGLASAWYSSGWRLNPFFKYAGSACPDGPHRDVRNNTLSISFTPFAWRARVR